MALTDILADSSNVSAVIEVFTLFFIVAGFFRWYDSKYQKTIRETKDDVISKMHDMQNIICDRLTRIDSEIIRIEDRLHKHITAENSSRRLKEKTEEEENETY